MPSMMTVLLRSFRRSRDAASAVEFAIVVPLFVMLVFGIVVYGSWLGMMHSVQQLAAEAARTSIGGLTEAERASLARAYITGNADSYPLLTPTKLTVVAQTSSSDANVFTVTVTYDATGSLISTLPSFVPAPSPHISRSAAIPRGGY